MKFTLKKFLLLLLITCSGAGKAHVLPMQPISLGDASISAITTSAEAPIEASNTILWVTDTHLTPSNIHSFITKLQSQSFKALFITGDITDDNLIDMLRQLATHITVPIYFVLGNSDSNYGKDLIETRAKLADLMIEKPNLVYLHGKVIQPDHELTQSKTAIVGLDGYADAWNIPAANVKNDVDTFEKNVRDALKQGAKQIVILTHVPPFTLDCWYKGKVATADTAPRYSSAASAAVFSKLADEFPDVKFTVYAGHTHNSSFNQHKPNLSVYVGANKVGDNFEAIYNINSTKYAPDLFHFSREGGAQTKAN
jgi:predicted phosphodiesterase